ncbi:MAG: glucose-6-phosphate isomerase, partial [Sphingomicrobium sp.]
MADSAWHAIETHEVQSLQSLFADDPERLAKLSFELANIYFDWSKTHLDEPLLAAFHKLAEECGFDAGREALFSGGIVNPSEGRPAEHVAERGNGSTEAVDLAKVRRQRVRALVDAVEGEAFGELTGVLHIGIGGSVLGPALLVDALGRGGQELHVRFLSNIDGQAVDDSVEELDPHSTLIVVVSKTFTTAETLSNMSA